MSSIIKSSQVNIVEPKIRQNTETLENKESDKSIEEIDQLQNECEETLRKAKEEAKDLINNAKKEAEKIKDQALEDARDAAENLKNEAYEKGYGEGKEKGNIEGYEDGRQNGYKEGQEESQKLIEEANEIKREYLSEKERVLNSIEGDVIELVMNITRKILNQKIDENDEVIIDLVLKGLATLNSKEDVRIRVSKEDFEKVEESREKILSKVNLVENLKIDIDSNLEKGDCIIESSKGNVDVSIDTQMKIVEEELKDLLDSE